MSDPLHQFEILATRARGEIAPTGDVTTRTLLAIGDRTSVNAFARPLAVCAGAYGLFCMAGLLGAYWYVTRDPDPMTSFFAMASDITP